MSKYSFAIIGSGWRAQYYVRIAKALPEIFELKAVFCRTQEKADSFSKEHDVHTTTSEEEIVSMKPDFVVVAVKKTEGFNVSRHWLEKGFTVLAETPAATDEKNLAEVQQLEKAGAKLVSAEQYIFYPEYAALLKLLEKNLIGPVNYVSISCAHEYHGSSLLRHFLDVDSLPKKIASKAFEFPTTETLSRYESFTDGHLKDKKRTIALIEFDGNKTALYDFDSEQYRSPIRKNLLKIQGTRGEIHDRKVYYLDVQNQPRESEIRIESRIIETNNTNPNLHFVSEITKITFEGEVLYEPYFGLCGLAQDETAIAWLMQSVGQYAKEEASEALYPLKKAIIDAKMMFMMNS